ncbi:MAG: superoxide dismutase [Dermatophilus congolensis]|nr:superoxide dismutase [Dermatophilus congolensis]
MSDYVLPDLSYDYGALEPHLSGQILELHHGKHHATYVAGANTAIEQLEELGKSGDASKINLVAKNLAFNLGGHINHSIFWSNMSPDGGDKPVGDTATLLDEHFGGFDKFRDLFTANALGIQGSGWSVLAWDSLAQRPTIGQQYDHQGQFPTGQTPLLMLDMWEHAFYLQYKNVKPDFVKAWWNLVDWNDVEARLKAAKGVKLV